MAPENTMEAFKKAIDVGSDGIELDVQLSADGMAMVCHDERLERTTSGKGYLKDLSASELRKLDAGAWFSLAYSGTKMPFLAEVLDLLKHNNLMLNIEIKTGIFNYPGIEEKVIRLVREAKMADRVVLSSFNHYTLMTCKKIAPEIAIGLLYSEIMVNPWDYAWQLGAEALHPMLANLLVPGFVAECHKQDIAVRPWTVDEVEQIKIAFGLGVDAVISNVPDVALAVRDGRGV
jgi:glycerophosphoryl diester phosphodiesterase